MGWLLPRAGLLLLALLAIVAVMGMSIDAVYAAAVPTVPLEANLQDIQLRGWLPAARAAVAFCSSLAMGALVGRQLPAILASILVSGLHVTGTMGASELIARVDPVVDPGPGGLITDFFSVTLMAVS